MAVYEHGLLGPFKGKVGATVGSNWRDIKFMRSLPRPSPKPATEKQLAQRMKFSKATDFLTPLRSIIKILPEGKSKGAKTDFNEAVSIVMKNMEGEYPNFVIPYKDVALTSGSLMGVFLSIDGVDDEGIHLSWSTRLGYGASDHDVVNLVLYSEETLGFYPFNDGTRGAGSFTIPREELGEGDCHIWVYTESVDGVERSNNKYYGPIEMK